MNRTHVHERRVGRGGPGRAGLAGRPGADRRGIAYDQLVDTYRVLYPKASNVGTSHGFTGKTTGAKIDYVLVEPSTVTEKAQIIHDNAAGSYPSDHFPVSAQISFR